MSSVKRVLYTSIVATALSLALAGCMLPGSTTDRGRVVLSLTDAPIVDASDVEGVFITVTGVSYHVNDEWIEAEGFSGPVLFNLLELTSGNVAPLDETVLPAGEVTQIRFLLDAAVRGRPVSGNPGCYIAFDPDGSADGDPSDDVHEPLFVPSGAQTGYKAIGPFAVPAGLVLWVAVRTGRRRRKTD